MKRLENLPSHLAVIGVAAAGKEIATRPFQLITGLSACALDNLSVSLHFLCGTLGECGFCSEC